jgi:N6-L-threonylcarbamoyladenine synthase
VAKLLGLGYPGGPAIDRLAAEGNDRAVALPRRAHAPRSQRARSAGPPRFQLQRSQDVGGPHVAPRRTALALSADTPLPEGDVRDVCASFQRVVTGTLIDALFDAAREPARGRWGLPEAFRPTAGSGATRWRAAPRRGCPCSCRR